jgi:hypothetical protein
MNKELVSYRPLMIYAFCVPVAVFIGYMLTNPMNYSTLGIFGILALLLISPLLLRWHYPLLILSQQVGMALFFIKGQPSLGVLMTAVSFGISLLERAMNRNRQFIRVPEITWPLLCIGAVVLFTASLTGGIGMQALGSDVYGGKKYVFLILGIMLYFALTAQRIPPERARLYVALYFVGALLSFISDLYPLAPHWAMPVFWFFTPNTISISPYGLGETRLGGFCSTGVALFCLLMAYYGIRGILVLDKPWRLILFILSIVLVFLGGYRGQLFVIGVTFIFMFFLEKLHRTKLLPILMVVGVAGFMVLIPYASKLPFTFQRTLAFLPLHLDNMARESARDTLNWRLDMWKALLPQVPQHLLLGKGLAISREDFQLKLGEDAPLANAAAFDPTQDPLAISYDYHNGPLSILIPFGIWGAITFMWLMVVGVQVLYANCRYCDPSLKTINLYLFASFLTILVSFLFVGGSLSGDLMRFTCILGLSVAINGGKCKPVPQLIPETVESGIPRQLPRLLPVFER